MTDTPAGDVRDRAWARLTATANLDRRVALCWLFGLGLNRSAPEDVLLDLLDLGETGLLHRDDLPAGVMDAAVVHDAARVRAGAAESGRLSATQWDRLLTTTPDPRQREKFAELAAEQLAAQQRSRGGRGVGDAPHPDATPPRTPQEIAAAAAEVPDIDPADVTTALWWVGALHENAEAMRQLAASPKLLVRRSVARAPRLPTDVVATLARDQDRIVRLFLAESCDDAPPAMLLEVAAWWEGSPSFPGRPHTHPNFPRDGLLRYAADPNPRMRILALADPASTSALAEQLSHDPDPIVRRAASEDHRLSPPSLRRLAADTDQRVRLRAWLNPSISAETLVTLLLDTRSAKHAARNPGIPIPVMRHMVTVARLPSPAPSM
ncbi:hypothetical protein BJY16_008147 [Actinoplanes octamycinicus]|uniref:Leucine rich repeat (LRR) protein n=1 Tax=Actinoplanes octamycinicus TaxID=135948 RepID=A0A7W7H615_9ACTN|nr:hypothetical protein [Actinoplanes octamycinicus]MBB4744688.1 hypothetical protein [Actinoplanes octamycinicus]